MKIEWLDEELTTAKITRGWWRPVCAVVKRNGYEQWCYLPSTDPVDFVLMRKLELALGHARHDARLSRNWAPAAELPEARLLADSEPW